MTRWACWFVVVAVAGCPGSQDEDVENVAGTYPITVTLVTGDCLAQDTTGTLLNTSFLTWIGDSGQAGTVEVEQSGTELTFSFEDCSFSGTVNAQSTYYFGGDCDLEDGATITVTSDGTVGPTDEDPTRARLEGRIVIDADYMDATGALGPDGEIDCSREVDIVGAAI